MASQVISKVNGVLQCDWTGNSADFTIVNQIPQQTLTLERIRVQCDTLPNALTLGRVYIELPFISSSSIINANNVNSNNSRICILLEGANVVTCHHPKLHLDMKSVLENNFSVRVFDINGNLTSNVVNTQLVFSYDYGFHS